MRLANCKKCGAVFRTETADLCEKCREEERLKINAIRDFIALNQNKTTSIEAISKATNVDVKEIYNLFKRGKLICMNETVKLKCQVCGTEITGRVVFCPKCAGNLKTTVEELKDAKIIDDTKFLSGKQSASSKSKETNNHKFGFKKDYK